MDAVGLTVGIVVGAGIFAVPSLVAGNSSSVGWVVLAWVLGGVISLLGALVYAELAAAFPLSGGDYSQTGRREYTAILETSKPVAQCQQMLR